MGGEEHLLSDLLRRSLGSLFTRIPTQPLLTHSFTQSLSLTHSSSLSFHPPTLTYRH